MLVPGRGHTAAVAIAIVRDHNIAGLELVVIQALAALPIGEGHLTEAAGAQVIGRMEAPVVARAARLAQSRGINQ